ncbi:hypothetical protein M405DRAFT_357236 [Rhizopogon salebrosus TDB-379]|nr:hypothetical protein M405DRAFT_357236 [Rhizopogon salebrosus TDB-379]
MDIHHHGSRSACLYAVYSCALSDGLVPLTCLFLVLLLLHRLDNTQRGALPAELGVYSLLSNPGPIVSSLRRNRCYIFKRLHHY